MTKTTHTIQDVEGLLLELVIKLKTAETKEERIKIKERIKKLEKHLNECNDKHINGKKYPERMQGFPDDKPMNKTEVLKLIDSIGPIDYTNIVADSMITAVGLNLEGVSVGKDTFEFIDKGWSESKTMKPDPFFK